MSAPPAGSLADSTFCKRPSALVREGALTRFAADNCLGLPCPGRCAGMMHLMHLMRRPCGSLGIHLGNAPRRDCDTGFPPCATGSHRLERPVPASPFTLTSGPFEAPISLRPAPRRADRGCRRNAAPRYRPPGASAMVMAFAWTLSPTNNRSFFMVWLTPFCRPSGPAFAGSVSASLRLLCIGLLTGDTATAVTPPLRLCAVLPRNPRHRLSVKSRQEADTRVSPYQL